MMSMNSLLALASAEGLVVPAVSYVPTPGTPTPAPMPGLPTGYEAILGAMFEVSIVLYFF